MKKMCSLKSDFENAKSIKHVLNNTMHYTSKSISERARVY